MVFSLASSGPLENGRLEKKETGKPLDPLQRLHDTARQARAFSRRLEKRRRRDRRRADEVIVGPDISSGRRDVKGAAVTVEGSALTTVVRA
jgi:hypothetical protein